MHYWPHIWRQSLAPDIRSSSNMSRSQDPCISFLPVIKRFQILWNLLLFFLVLVLSLLFFFFPTSMIGIANLRNRTTFSHQTPLICRPLSDDVQCVLVLIRITILDLEPNLCFQTLLIISKTYHRIFNCNISKRRSGQELPFIFFELRAPTCLWGRYDPKTENFTLFYIYLLHIHPLSITFYILV